MVERYKISTIMKHAVLILAHNNPNQLARLVNVLDSDSFDFFIHVDQKAPIDLFKAAVITKISSVYFLYGTKRYDIILNDFSLVEATCELMKAATFKNVDYQYFILLTGQDYPIKNISYITTTLENSYPTAYIDSYSVYEAKKHNVLWVEHVGHSWFSQTMRRSLLKFCGRKFYYSEKGKLVKFLPKILDYINTKIEGSPRNALLSTGYEYSVGSHFWMLPDIAVKFILDKYTNDKYLNHIFRNIAAPEESYFQTVLSAIGNQIAIPAPWAQFSSQIAEMDNPALRLIKWYDNGRHTDGHPAIWKSDDMGFISKAKALFARKFDINVDSSILNQIDTEILHRI